MSNLNYKINGDDLQFVEIILSPGESLIGEAGSLMYMHQDISMDTILGDGSNSGVLNTIFSAGKKMLTGESLFCTSYKNEGSKDREVSFAAPYIGKIIPIHLKEYHNAIIAQKTAFLCAEKGTKIGIKFQKRLTAGFFGGEGFILQKFEGDKTVFLHACGGIIKKELKEEDSILVDAGCLVAYTEEVNFDIKYVGSIKTTLFGGEGLFLAKLKGPGSIWLQSLPFSRLASRVFAAAPEELRFGNKN